MEKKPLPPEPFCILMADDDPDDQLLLSEAFDDVYMRNPLQMVNDGEELLDFLNRRGNYTSLKETPLPRLILLDLNMPRMDGRKALAEIRANSKLKSIPIIILTTSKAEEDIAKSYDLGANSYIIKPVTIRNLMQVVTMLGDYWTEIVTLPPQIDD